MLASPTPSVESLPSICSSSSWTCLSSPSSSISDLPSTLPSVSKKDYLIAQLKQKDMMIESLLKQLHNPYIATPLSLEAYKMATSPSHKDHEDVIKHREQLKASIRKAGGTAGPQAFKVPRGPAAEEDDSDHEESSHARGFGFVAPGQDEDEDSADATPDDKLLSSLPDCDAPLGLIANLSVSNSNSRKKSAKAFVDDERRLEDNDVGVANETYFLPGPASNLSIRATLIEQHSPPEILIHGLVTPEDVDELFKIFFEKVDPFISLLDPVLHTPATTFARCPFLFTVSE
ncbi:hypothetical protein H0H81_004448 [Sphagnurus paluster]|uniref:Uncharacterized protein n=1 Tax=Sphagnurus paluster TaxID=117069 RepID=A0A9P7FYM9_9AGAR|nr:hypothetical protein H0H81_004448 [Sphagnurus paluster]